tara:strand:- start:263 stop:676 length:414 start_codon:yes stop_codon:yes gene_type:complete
MSLMKGVKHFKSCWTGGSSTRQTPWGEERSWSALTGIVGKILYMKEGHRNSLKYNVLKDECLFVLDGEIEVEYGSELSIKDPTMHPFQKKILSSGECLNVQSGSPYRIKALTAARVIEIGTGLREHKIRIEDDYGRK